MAVWYQVLVLVHLIGFASLFGGFLVQLRTAQPEVNAAMLHGGLLQLVSGLGLAAFNEFGVFGPGNAAASIDYVQLGIKLGVTVFVVLLLIINRRFASIPRGLWAMIGVLTLGNAGLAVLWQ